MNPKMSRRGFLLASLALAGAGVAACSTSTSGSSNSSEGTNPLSVTAAEDTFPVTVEHNFGSTTISSKPQRVATVGYLNADVVASLGVIPVATGKVTWGGNENGSNPWLDAQIENVGAERPTFYDETDGINFTAIAESTPDLILCLYGNLSQEEYDKLSSIAPTVTYTSDGANWNESWQGATRQAAKALGVSALGEIFISETQARLRYVSKDNSILTDTTYIAGYLNPGTDTGISIYAPTDGRSRILEDIGLEQSPAYDLIDFDGSFYASWSPERADELDSDIFFTWTNSPEDKQAIIDNPLLSHLPSVERGGLLAVSDQRQGIALYSVIGLNWLLDESDFVDNLVAAAQGNGDATSSAETSSASN